MAGEAFLGSEPLRGSTYRGEPGRAERATPSTTTSSAASRPTLAGNKNVSDNITTRPFQSAPSVTEKPSPAIVAMPTPGGRPKTPDNRSGSKSYTIRRGDTIDAIKKRLFPTLSDQERSQIRVRYKNNPQRQINPRRIQPGKQLLLTPPGSRPKAKPGQKPGQNPGVNPGNKPAVKPEGNINNPPNRPNHPPAELKPISPGFSQLIDKAARDQKFDAKAFKDKINALASKYQCDPNDLLAIMNCETGGKLSPSTRNPQNGATGLIQFTRRTAKSLGTTTEDLGKMSAVEQLKVVDRYLARALKNHRGPLNATDLYLSVFYPSKVGQGNNPNAEIINKTRSPKTYRLNQSLDTRNNQGQAGADGIITAGELQARLKRWYPNP